MHPNDGRVLCMFIVQALLISWESLGIYGDGLQIRSCCYVDDLVTGLIQLMEQAGFIGPANLGNPEEITVLGLAEFMLKLTGGSSKIEFRPLPADDPR